MQIQKYFLFFFILFGSMACTVVHKGQIVSLDYGQPVRPENQAIGSASVTYFMGWGGNKTAVLLKEAKDDLIYNRPLKEGEKYVNVNLNNSTTFFLFLTKQQYTITADVFSPYAIHPMLVDSSSSSAQSPPLTAVRLFEKGDTLYSLNGFEGFFISQEKGAKIKYFDTKGFIQFGKESKLYSRTASFKEFELYEKVVFSDDQSKVFTIVGFGLKKALLFDEYDQSMFSLYYDKLQKPVPSK
jgi:hypothetical protein